MNTKKSDRTIILDSPHHLRVQSRKTISKISLSWKSFPLQIELQDRPLKEGFYYKLISKMRDYQSSRTKMILLIDLKFCAVTFGEKLHEHFSCSKLFGACILRCLRLWPSFNLHFCKKTTKQSTVNVVNLDSSTVFRLFFGMHGGQIIRV